MSIDTHMDSHMQYEIALVLHHTAADYALQFVVVQCDVRLQFALILLDLAAQIATEHVLAGLVEAHCLPGFMDGYVT